MKELACKLTDEEKLTIGKELADANGRVEELELEKKSVVAGFKKRGDDAAAEIGVLSRKVSTGEEHRLIKCIWAFDWHGGQKSLSRLDTGEVVLAAEITEGERQQHLALEEKEREALEEGEDAGEE
jgi:hypothetical protein